MRLVVLESPYAGRSPDGPSRVSSNRLLNVEYARAAMHDCLMRNEAPFASHLLYTQPGVLDDDKPAERRLGMEAGFAWGEKAGATVVYCDLGISKGMQDGIDRAERAGRAVEYRYLFK